MSVIVRTALLAAALSLTAAPLMAADGLLIVQKHVSADSTTISQVQIEKTRMRVDRGIGGRGQVIVFDGAAQLIRMIDPEKKSYFEMTKDDIDRMKAQMSGAMAQMQEQMKNMPPEQRQRMEALMRGRGVGGAAVAEKTEYRRNGSDRVGKWSCDKYDGYKKGEKVSEICTVSLATLGITVADFDITKLAANFFQQLSPQAADQMFTIGSAELGFSGIPVRSVVTVGQRQVTTELTEVTRKSFSDDSYAVPAGFQKQPFPGAGGRRGRQQ